MKRILILAVLICITVASNGQDLITPKKGDVIEAKILEVTSAEVKYKKWNNQEGPTFVINKGDIMMIVYQNGDRDVYDIRDTNKPSQGIHEGMNYRDYKNLYDAKTYVHDAADAVNPVWAGIASFFIPGLGQCISGEWGRGLGFFFGELGGTILMINMVPDTNTTQVTNGQRAALWAFLLGLTAVDVWNIVNAVHVTKIKNMYYQDLRRQKASIDLKMEPYFAGVETSLNAGYQPVAGVTLTMTF
jgi:hypothetical protein